MKTPPLFDAPPPTGAYMFGLNIPAVVRLMELLPGAFFVIRKTTKLAVCDAFINVSSDFCLTVPFCRSGAL